MKVALARGSWLWVVLGILALVYIYSVLGLLAVTNTIPEPFSSAIRSLPLVAPPHSPVYSPWGLLVAVYVFLVTTGLCIVASWGSLFRVEEFQAAERRLVWLSLVTLVVGLVTIAIEVGRTERALYFYLGQSNLESNMMWMIIFYTCYALFLPVELWLHIRYDVARLAKESSGLRRIFYLVLSLGVLDTSPESRARDEKLARVFSGIVLAVSLSAYANMGSIFSTSRTIYYDNPLLRVAYMPSYFIALGVLVGVSAYTLLLAVRAPEHLEKPRVQSIIARIQLASLILCTLLLAVWEAVKPLTKKPELPVTVLQWLLGSIAPLALLLAPIKIDGRRKLVIVSALVLAGTFILRYDMTVGRPLVLTAYQPYTPSPLEMLYTIGVFGVCILVYLVGEKILPLGETVEERSGGGGGGA